MAAFFRHIRVNPWVIYDPSESSLDRFLQINAPSVTKRSDGISWISVRGPRRYPRSREVESEDRVGLQKAWKSLQKSGRPITHDDLLDLARAYKYTSGKWLFYVDSGSKVDDAWAKIAKAVVSGKCGMSAKVSSHENAGGGKERQQSHVICVYNEDCTDEDSVFELESAIRGAGIKHFMMYKPDAFTTMGIYSRNKWKISPTTYRSRYDTTQGKSNVTAVN